MKFLERVDVRSSFFFLCVKISPTKPVFSVLGPTTITGVPNDGQTGCDKSNL
jgi:hypothetical protein